MSNSFPPELAEFVEKELAPGQYQSEEELICDKHVAEAASFGVLCWAKPRKCCRG